MQSPGCRNRALSIYGCLSVVAATPLFMGAAAWILRPSFQTRLYHGSAELAERPASMQASLRWNDDGTSMKKIAEEQKAWQ